RTRRLLSHPPTLRRPMNWADDFLQLLASSDSAASGGLGYRQGGTPAAEPTALAALALIAWERTADADAQLRWLADAQTADGSLGINAQERSPAWPTPLAVLAWRAGNTMFCTPPSSLPQRLPWSRNIRSAVDW